MTTIVDLGKLRFYWAGDWIVTTEYELNDVVRYGGNVYVYVNVLKTIGSVPTNTAYWAVMVEGINFIGEWDAVTQYYIGDAVAYGSTVYVSLSDNLDKQPDIFPAIWSQFAEGIQWEGDYSPTTSYQTNDVVKYGPNAYIAKQTTVNNLPTNTVYWDAFVTGISAQGVYSNITAYTPNDIVAYGANLYIAVANTVGNLPTNVSFWAPFLSSFQNRGAWATTTEYFVNDLVQYGANTYAAQIQAVSGDFAVDLAAGKWSIFVSGLRQRGAWATSTQYLPYDIVVYGGNTYSCLVANNAGTFATDLASGYWQIFNGGLRWRNVWAQSTEYLVNDIVRQVGSSYIATEDFTSGSTFSVEYDAGKWEFLAQGADDVLPVIQPGQIGYSLTVDGTGAALAWLNATSGSNVLYVAENGNDTNPGSSMALPFRTIQAAVAGVPSGQKTAIFVKSGTYAEVSLPIVVPANVAIMGDSVRTTFVIPGAGLAADGVTANEESTMWHLSEGSLLNKMTFQGMTGWVPGSTPGSIVTSTPKGIFCAVNPLSPVIFKSPYVIECSSFSNGGIGAYVNGDEHVNGNRSILFHEYTNIHNNGVGIWVDNNGKSECVGVFTYYCYFGYATTNGGQIRSISGNNSYGTYGSVSSGFSAAEIPVTGTLYGSLITFTGPYTGIFNPGDTLDNGSGVTANATNVQATSVYVDNVVGGVFAPGDVITSSSGGTGVVSTYGGQEGYTLVLNGLSANPLVGQSVQIAGDTSAYILTAVSGAWFDATSVLSISLAQIKPTASAAGSAVTLRSFFSLLRITAHDFLNVGTGGVTTTNYPNTPTQSPVESNRISQDLPGRVYYVSADEQGNFNIGEYFAVNQATGAATLNANSFNLSGLNSLRLGSIGAQLGAQINEFTTDGTMSQNSPVKVPTQSAVVTYVTTAIAAIPTTATTVSFVTTISEDTTLVAGTMTFGMETLTVEGSSVYTIPTGSYFFVMNPDGFALFN